MGRIILYFVSTFSRPCNLFRLSEEVARSTKNTCKVQNNSAHSSTSHISLYISIYLYIYLSISIYIYIYIYIYHLYIYIYILFIYIYVYIIYILYINVYIYRITRTNFLGTFKNYPSFLIQELYL